MEAQDPVHELMAVEVVEDLDLPEHIASEIKRRVVWALEREREYVESHELAREDNNG